MAELDRKVQKAVDRLAIIDVLHRYTTGVDAFDAELTASCFTEDCRYHLGEEVTEGRAALTDVFADRTGVRKQTTGLDIVESFTHALSNIVIDFDTGDPDRATAESMVTAYVIGPRDGNRVMLVRLVRYADDLVRQGDEWLIAERRHVLHWMYEATPTMVLPTAVPVPG